MRTVVLLSAYLITGGFLLAVNVFIIHQLEKKYSEINSNDIAPLCCYRYSFGVDLLGPYWRIAIMMQR